MKKTLKNLIPLEHNIKIYVPSTQNVDQIADTSEYVQNTLNDLTTFYGGATSYEAYGSWLSASNKLVKEHITICEAYCNEKTLKGTIDQIITICEDLKKDLHQEAISLEIDNKLYFV